tara:strand:+ start:283 stop:1803 length:1521 start_codon:yes stop_codon:yes gene_type:complete
MAKRSGRSGRLQRDRANLLPKPYPVLARSFAPTDVLSPEELERIHDASMTILEEFGVQFRDRQAIEFWRQLGVKTDGEMVFLDRNLVMELVSKAPANFKLSSPNPERDVEIGGAHTAFAPMVGAPFVRDLDGVRRNSTLADLDNFNRLSELLPCMHITSSTICEPTDIAVPHRHLDMNYSSLTLTDLPFFGGTTTVIAAEDSIAMAQITHGEDFIANKAYLIGHVAANSPKLWDEVPLRVALVYAAANQPVMLSPFALAAANTPADIAAAVAQINAEALAGIAYIQANYPGTKTIYGNYIAAVSLQSGAPMAATPEVSLITLAIGQLCRKYRLPWRTTGSQASSKSFDAQSGFESATSTSTALYAGANVILHSAGWDESGLVICYAKFVADAEQNELVYRLGRGISFDRFEEAINEVNQIAPGGHYLGTEFTRKYFKDAFCMPKLLDYTSFEQWRENGAKDMCERSIERAKEMLAKYVQPVRDQGALAALDEFVARRKREISPSLE